MIHAVDILFICLAIGFIVFVVFIVILINRMMRTLDHVDAVLEDVKSTTHDIELFKSKAKSTFFTAASTILGMVAGRRR